MGFLLSGLWHLASLLDWTSVVSPALGVLARWYAGPLGGLTRLLARAWDGFTRAGAPAPRDAADRSVVVMLTQHAGGRIAVRSAYLLFYGVTGAVVLAVKLVAEGACLGFCLARAGLVHLTGPAVSSSNGMESSSTLAESQLVPPPAVCSSLDAADRSAAESLSNADVSLLLSSAFCRVPDAVPPADLTGTEFVCVALDDDAAAQTAQFERSLQAELPPDAPLVAVAADRARAFVCAAQDAPSAPAAAAAGPTADPTPTLHEFLAECRGQPLPAPPPLPLSQPPQGEHQQEEDVDLVTAMCPSLASSQMVPGTSNNSLLSGWVMLKRYQQ